MRIIKQALIFFIVLLLTWLALSTFIWLCGEFVTFKYIATNPVVIIIMTVVGWVPAAVVLNNYNKRYE